ncbi:hypothetical protein [Kineococcus indalonis]|uniref:hypothetical protein n=1 Tax=Kineococcus indalonis TaxID=2696566 RepID=UPI0014129105|nr:hypothetical protein [Kineococcus indalonis]NAZ86032.1 hypothetical protein [Kineococcus indalonis]
MSTPLARRAATALTCLALAAGVAACGAHGEGGAQGGARAECTLDGCTATFPRTGGAEVSVLGVQARLLEAEEGSVRLEVAGQEVSLDVGTEAQVAGFTAGLDRLTDTEAVVVLRR